MNIFERQLPQEWYYKLLPYFDIQKLNELSENIENEYLNHTIFPPINELFTAFELTTPENIKMVIVGQDPYPTIGHAHGLAFSVKNTKIIPPSLRNIYKEIENEFNITLNKNGNLTPLAKQGVLLINSILTVREGLPNSHYKLGWEYFILPVFKYLNSLKKPLCVLLWGNNSREYSVLFNNPQHLILESAHPSPLSARRGFWGCNHFILANQFYISNNEQPINFIEL